MHGLWYLASYWRTGTYVVPASRPAQPGRNLRWDTRLRLLVYGGVLACLCLAPPAATSIADEPEEKVRESSVTGEIVAINKRAVSVEFASSTYGLEEMLLPLDAKVKVEGPKTLADLVPGDRVKVSYRQTYREDPNDQKFILNTVATNIVLVRSSTSGSLRSSDEELSQ